MNPIPSQAHPDSSWYCVRSQPKRECIAASHLHESTGIPVYCPRLKIRKSTPRGPVWFHEALFPGYFFARFHLETEGDQVRHTRGVRTLVHFGLHCPSIADEALTALMEEFPPEGPVLIEKMPEPGEMVEFVSGPFRGLSGQVKSCLSGRDRVQVLLNFLGSVSSVEAEPWMLASGD